MTTTLEEIRIKGRTLHVPSVTIQGRTVVVTGRWLRIAAIKDEEVLCGVTVPDATDFIATLRQSPLHADLFSFSQRVPDIIPRYPYHLQWDNAAAIEITTYDNWWTTQVEPDVRKAVKKAARLGVEVRLAAFDDAFVRGIVEIYNDAPIRQGKAFWHFRKPFEQVKHENATYLDRSAFIGAYLGNDLLGFIKLVYLDNVAATLQVISKKSAYDKKVVNALIAQTVALCAEKKMTHLVYGSFSYDNQVNSLSEFKRRHGFREVKLPTYFVPLTMKGRAALSARLHQGVQRLVPRPIVSCVRNVRTRFAFLRQNRLALKPHPANSLD